jgi:hypothetical protein
MEGVDLSGSSVNLHFSKQKPTSGKDGGPVTQMHHCMLFWPLWQLSFCPLEHDIGNVIVECLV